MSRLFTPRRTQGLREHSETEQACGIPVGHRIPGQGAENEQGWNGILGTQPLSCRALMLQPSQEAAARPITARTQDTTASGRALPLILVRQIPAFHVSTDSYAFSRSALILLNPISIVIIQSLSRV